MYDPFLPFNKSLIHLSRGALPTSGSTTSLTDSWGM